jgi:predicted DNA-binding helix-hairpin-helix protein
MGLYYFCCNECQYCYHRERGTVPRGHTKEEFRRLCRERREMLDEHKRKVATKGMRGR